MQDKQGNLLDRREMLRVKVKSLAAESKMIRREEIKAKRSGKARVMSHMDAMQKLFPERVAAMTDMVGEALTAEQKAKVYQLLRQERKKKRGMGKFALFTELHQHRVIEVRRHARHASLAYGLLKGRRYEQMEQKCEQLPDWDEVARLIQKFGAPISVQAPHLKEGIAFKHDGKHYVVQVHR